MRLNVSRDSLLLVFLVIFTVTPAVAVEVSFSGKLDKNGVPAGWKLKEKTGDAELKVYSEDGESVVYFKSNQASFSLERELNLNPLDYPFISWRWKVLRLPLLGDVRTSKNDQAAQLLILFEGKKSISYVWDTTAPEGTVMDESIGWPVNVKIKVLVVKSGAVDLNRWITFKRNIVNDYRRLYNEDPKSIKGIRIQINTQHTGTVAETVFGRIQFSRD